MRNDLQLHHKKTIAFHLGIYFIEYHLYIPYRIQLLDYFKVQMYRYREN